ncbi:MAG: membrane protein insertion efficiency factor YidD [Deltaproteobacteria bacterium]
MGLYTIRYLVNFVIMVYQLAVSPFIGPCCRFYPSCSAYASEAILKYGTRKGGVMTFKRLLKCHPFHPGGVDPVP